MLQNITDEIKRKENRRFLCDGWNRSFKFRLLTDTKHDVYINNNKIISRLFRVTFSLKKQI